MKKEYLARNDPIERSMFAFSMKLFLANKRETINFYCCSWSSKHRNNSLTNCFIIIEFSKCHENAEKYVSLLRNFNFVFIIEVTAFKHGRATKWTTWAFNPTYCSLFKFGISMIIWFTFNQLLYLNFKKLTI